jgi:hypothetical protein
MGSVVPNISKSVHGVDMCPYMYNNPQCHAYWVAEEIVEHQLRFRTGSP